MVASSVLRSYCLGHGESVQSTRSDRPLTSVSVGISSVVNPRADWHLHNWAEWQKRYHLGGGYPGHSSMLSTGGLSTEDSFGHMCEEADKYAARVTDSIVDELDAIHQTVLHHFYCAAVWRFRGDPMGILAGAVGEYWRKAIKQGLS